MISRDEAKNIAGRIFVGEFNQEYLKRNIKKLHLTECREKGRLVIDFCMFKNEIDTMMPTENGITVHEKDFPDILLTVAINLNDGKGEILFKTDKLN